MNTMPPYQRHSGSSRAGAVALASSGAHIPQRERVRLYVARCGATGATRQEIAEATGIAINAVCGRVSELLYLAVNGKPGLRRRAGRGRRSVAGVDVEVLIATSGQERLL